MHRKISAHVDGGGAEGLACTDPGARTPIGGSGNFYIILLSKHFWKKDDEKIYVLLEHVVRII